MNAADRYMDLLKRAVLGILAFDDTAYTVYKDRDNPTPMTAEELKKAVYRGDGILPGAETLLGWLRLSNLHELVEGVCQCKTPGDVIACGLWKGGSLAVLRAAMNVCGGEFRMLVACDSFEGLPPPVHPWDKVMALDDSDRLRVPSRYVDAMLKRYKLRDHVEIVEGWFKDTLPKMKDRQWSLIHCDCDFYESTMDVLINCYDQLSPGGFVIIDDYGTWAACREAVHDFRKERQITEKMIEVDTSAVYWRKK